MTHKIRHNPSRLLAALLLSLVLVAAAIPHRASATPPNVVTIDDTVLGANDTHLFVLRSTGDNYGSHYIYRSEVWLVAIAFEDGGEEMWPVQAVTETTEFTDDADIKVLKPDALPDRVDPFAVMAERDAVPLLIWRSTAADRTDVSLVSDTHVQLGEFGLDRRTSEEAARKSVRAWAANVKDADRPGAMSTLEYYEYRAEELGTCRYEAEGWPIYNTIRSNSVQLVRVTCADEDDMEKTSLIQIARRIPPAVFAE